MSIGSVGEEDFDEVEMKKAGRDDGKKDVAHLEEVKVAIKHQPSNAGKQDTRPRDGEGDVGLSYDVKVDDRTPVTAFRADVDHFGEAVGDLARIEQCLAGWEMSKGVWTADKSSRSNFMGWPKEGAIAGRPKPMAGAFEAPP